MTVAGHSLHAGRCQAQDACFARQAGAGVSVVAGMTRLQAYLEAAKWQLWVDTPLIG